MITIITGTDTGVGKTIATAALATRAALAGSVAIVKPAQTGVTPEEPGDLDEIRRLTAQPTPATFHEAAPRAAQPTSATVREGVSGAAQGGAAAFREGASGAARGGATGFDDGGRLAAPAGLITFHEGVRLRDPLAPTTAARREGVLLPTVEEHAKLIDDLAATHDTVLVEGAGGLLVGLDAEGRGLADLAEHLTTPFGFVVVTRSGLGTLNHTGLTVEALRRRNLPIDGLIIGSWPTEPDLAEQCNLEDLPTTTGVPVIARIPAGASATDGFASAAPGWFA
ncbi:ATP-dependent dethiobiotin synthetase BioD [Kribbella sp. NPDC050470]|uniref:ATP-dependent dethiobiotin synthetase BioD n=1 Tax=unclassified Kribbella TaxID=2644121 RepID=UPI0037B57739